MDENEKKALEELNAKMDDLLAKGKATLETGQDGSLNLVPSGMKDCDETRSKLGRVILKEDAVPKDKLPEMFAKGGFEFQDGDEERVVKTVASDGSVDRDGDILHPDGWDLKEFKSNPVLLFMHDMRSAPIGGVIDVFTEPNPDAPAKSNDAEDMSHLKNRLSAFPYFARTKAGNEQLILFKSGVMRAFSVRFRASRIKDLADDQKEKLGMDRYGLFFLKQALRELSAVTIPSNPNALVTAKSFEEKLDQAVKRMDDILETVTGRLEKLQTVPELNKRIDELNGKVKTFLQGQQELATTKQDLYPAADEDALSSLLETANAARLRLSGA